MSFLTISDCFEAGLVEYQALAARGEISENDAFLHKPFGTGEVLEKVLEVFSAAP